MKGVAIWAIRDSDKHAALLADGFEEAREDRYVLIDGLDPTCFVLLVRNE